MANQIMERVTEKGLTLAEGFSRKPRQSVKPKRVRLDVRLRESELQQLTDLEAATGLNKSEIIRRCIAELHSDLSLGK